MFFPQRSSVLFHSFSPSFFLPLSLSFFGLIRNFFIISLGPYYNCLFSFIIHLHFLTKIVYSQFLQPLTIFSFSLLSLKVFLRKVFENNIPACFQQLQQFYRFFISQSPSRGSQYQSLPSSPSFFILPLIISTLYSFFVNK